MFLSKLALYGTIAGTFFAVSAFSTVQITKQMNKTAIPNDEEELEEDEASYVRKMSDTEQFINSISNCGNLEGHLDASITKGNNLITISGDVFVSMETLEDIQFDADITIQGFDHTFNIEATYVNNTIYTSVEGANIKLETSALEGVTELFSLIEIESPVELPESFKNIDSNTLISNLSAMTAEKGDDSIVYTCNLIDGIPPLTFITDLDYNLTALSIEGVDIAGFNIDLNASVNILGKGHNRVTSPENENNVYTDLTHDVNEMKKGIVNQINSLVNRREIGISNYHIEVFKEKTIEDNQKINELVFNMDGDANIAIGNKKQNTQTKVSLNGNLTNTNAGKELDTNLAFRLYEGSLYFDYNNELKLRYSIEDINDLVKIIKTKITNNTDTDIGAVLDKVFPSNSSITSAPIVEIVKTKNYLQILDYYVSATANPETNSIGLIFDGALIGNNGSNIIITCNLGDQGINNVSINNVYALGYTLNLSFDLGPYQSFSVLESEQDDYTDLKYFNNIFDELTDLIHKEQFVLTLDGKMDLGKGELVVKGDGYVSISDSKDFGVADLRITGKDQTHHIMLDVSRNKVSENASEKEKSAALRTSEVLFSYNDNLNGYLNLESISDTYDLIQDLAAKNNPLLSKIKGLLTKDTSNSTISKIMNGEPESILYDKSIEAISYTSGEDGAYYDIQLSGNLLKSNKNDVVSPVHVYINLDEDNHFQGIGIKGKLNSYSVDLDLSVNEASENTISWKRLTKDSSYKDFSELRTLAEYLFNTGAKKDFTLTGSVNVNALNLFDVASLGLDAKVHIDEDTGDTISEINITNIPVMQYLFGTIKVSEGEWDGRSFTIYITDDEVYLKSTYYTDEYENLDLVWDSLIPHYQKNYYQNVTTKTVRLTHEQFMDDIAYYLVNFGLGVKMGSVGGQNLNMKELDTSTNDNVIDYSSVLTQFSYTLDEDNPKWTVGINLAELAGTNILGELTATINGDNSSKILNSFTADTDIASIIHATINASLDSVDPLDIEDINRITSYIDEHDEDEYLEEIISDPEKVFIKFIP